MSLQQLQGVTTQNNPNMFFGNADLNPPLQPLGTGNLAGLLQPGLGYIGDGIHNRPLPDFGSRPPFITPLPDPHNPRYMLGSLKTKIEGLGDKFGSFGETLGGFGEQLTGYQDALGSFNEQVGGMGKQFETISNRLDSVDKGLGSLGNQIASLEQAQSQQVTQPQPMPQQPMYSPFGFGLGALFGRRF